MSKKQEFLQFSELFDTTSDWLWEVDQKGRYTYASPGVERLLGYSPQELLGHTPFEFMPDGEADKIASVFNKAKENNRPLEKLLNKAVHKDGHEVVFETSGLPIMDNGSTIGYRGIDRDVTQRVRYQEKQEHLASQLKETAALLESVLDAIPDIIGILDIEHRVVRYNAAGYEFFQKKPQEVAGQRCFELLGRENPCVSCSTREAISTKQPAQVTRFASELGRWLDARSYPLLNDKGEVVRIIEHVRDVTDEKRREQSLLHSQKLESLGVLAGGIAHDFNNLLTAIIGNADLAALDLPADSESHTCIRDLKDAAKRATELCSQMVAYAGKAKFIITEVDLPKLINDLNDLLRASVPKKIEINFDFPPSSPSILADAAQMRQMVMNLVTNAAEACEDKGAEITISIKSQHCEKELLHSTYFAEDLSAGEYVVLSVRDDGTGIDEKVMRHLFEPFYSTKFLGRGLGLAAVQGITRSHFGAIDVKSQRGEGSEFLVYIPTAENQKNADKAATCNMENNKKEKLDKIGTILIVDDEELVRRVAGSMVKRMGFRVLSANDGVEAVELYKKEKDNIDCILLDLTMPRLGGIETMKAIRELNKGAVIILSSGYPAEETKKRCVDIHPNGIVHKPYEYQKLTNQLKELLPESLFK